MEHHSKSGYKDGQCYLKNCNIHANSSITGSANKQINASKIHPSGMVGHGKMKGLSSIYQQDLRNKAMSGYHGGMSTFSLKSNQKVGKTSATISAYGN